MSFFRNVSGLLATSGFLTVANAVTGIALARLLSVDDRGLYSIATTFAAMTSTLVVIGWPSACIYQLRRLSVPPRVVASSGIAIQLSMTALAVLGGLALEPWLRERFFGDAPRIVYLLALAVVPNLPIAQGFAALSRGIDRFGFQNAYRAGLSAAQLIGFTFVLGVMGGGLVELMWTWLGVTTLLTVIFGLVVLSRTGVTWRLQGSSLRQGLRFGMKSYTQSVAVQLHEHVDVFMLAALLRDPGQVAFYTIAVRLGKLLYLISNAMTEAGYPRMASLAREEGARFAARISRQSLALVLVLALGLAVAAPILLPLLYGAPYRASVAPFTLLLPAMVFVTVYRTLAAYFTATNRQQISIAIQITSVALNIGLNFWLIPRYGIMGAAVATLGSYIFEAVVMSTVFSKWTGVRLREILMLDAEDVSKLRERLEGLLRRSN